MGVAAPPALLVRAEITGAARQNWERAAERLRGINPLGLRIATCPCRFARLLPKPKSAEERVVVVARSTSERQLLQFFDIAAADYDIVGFKHRDQPLDHVFNVMTPALLAQSLEPDTTEVVLVGGFL